MYNLSRKWKGTTGNKKKSNNLTTNRNTSMAFFPGSGKQKKYIPPGVNKLNRGATSYTSKLNQSILEKIRHHWILVSGFRGVSAEQSSFW